MDITSWFGEYQFLAFGAALISVPIIIHLINRMRYKRLRWAAMEFLLKAQKRSRRRLIIEQLLLLLLRCLLVALAALLVLRLTGCSALGTREEVHIVVLDDTLSMNDRNSGKGAEGTPLEVAQKKLLKAGILEKLKKSTSNDTLVILQLSRLHTEKDFKPLVFERLNDPGNYKRAAAAIAALKPSVLHVPLVEGVKRAQEIAAGHRDKNRFIHVVSDFRRTDWVKAGEAGQSAAVLQKSLLEAAGGKEPIQIRLWDTAFPYREKGADAPLASYKNVGITEFRANTRLTGRGMPVAFTVEVANFGPQDTDVKVKIFNEEKGNWEFEVIFNEPMPLKVPRGGKATCSFTLPFFPELKPNEVYHAHLSAHLRDAFEQHLEDDRLDEDNIRHVTVEVRNRIPILVIDGRGADGRKEGGDSFHLQTALQSPTNSRYEVVFADQLTGGDGREALEAPNLGQYATILLLNVPSLKVKQAAALDAYIRQGGGVGIFLGPDVDAAAYNESLYRQGKGFFPVALAEKFFPEKGPLMKVTEESFRRDQVLLLRDDEFPGAQIPVFGPIIARRASLRGLVKFMPVGRYFPVAPPSEEKKAEEGKGKDKERDVRRPRAIVSLPNDLPLIRRPPNEEKEKAEKARQLLTEAESFVAELTIAEDEHKAFQDELSPHRKLILKALVPNAPTRAIDLGDLIKALLADRALNDFWKAPALAKLKEQATGLLHKLRFGDPIMLVGRHGQGRVLVNLTTAGNAWNSWGSLEIYPIMIWEMQNYLSSQAGEQGRIVGSPLELTVDRRRFREQLGDKELQVAHYYYRPAPYRVPGKKPDERKQAAKETLLSSQLPDARPAAVQGGGDKGKAKGTDADKDGKSVAEHVDTFTFRKTLEPGLYVTKLRAVGAEENAPPLFEWAHAYNVPTELEGKLQRARKEDLQKEFLQAGGKTIVGPLEPSLEQTSKTEPQSDYPTETPWFFLIFFGILIAEQALAVHLSFHLRGSEADLPTQVVQPSAKAA